jgi:hypothetical protein
MGAIKILCLSGSKNDMGMEYGTCLKDELQTSFDILEKFFIVKHNIAYSCLLKKAEEFYNRFPTEYQEFIKAVAIGSGLPLGKIKILNAMEVIRCFLGDAESIAACSFINIPGEKTLSKSNIVGRNYDYAGEAYSLIAKNLIVTILKEINKVPVAFISMPGQIYAPTGINTNSLFLELNNAFSSGGFEVNTENQSLLINLLIALQNSKNFSELDNQLINLHSDFSLVVNAVDQHNVKSYEYSSFRGMKTYLPEKDISFASTNFYLNRDWGIKKPRDEDTWLGVSRRNNLMFQTEGDNYTAKDLMDMLDINLADGGAKLDYTIYQIVFETKTQSLYIKRTREDKEWTYINLHKLFQG